MRLTFVAYLSLLLSLCVLFSACNKSQEQSSTIPPTQSVTVSHNPTQILATERNAKYTPQTIPFDFGVINLTGTQIMEGATGTRTMPFPIRGTFFAPQGKTDAPVVMVLHGSHNNEDENLRFDTGFSYLGKALAEEGYAVVTLDLQNAYLWKYGDSQEKMWISQMFPIFLEKLSQEYGSQADFQQLMLLGHSRGGEVIFDLYPDYPQVKALLPLTPTCGYALPETPDIPVSILSSEWDGDVTTWDGYVKFDVRNATNRNQDLYFTVLNSANHNYFSTQLESRNDAALFREDLEGQLTPMQQQDFLCSFVADWCGKVFAGSTTNTLYDTSQPEPQSLYGLGVKCKYAVPEENKISLDLQKGVKSNVEVRYVKESFVPGQDEIEGFQYPLMNLPDYDRSQVPVVQVLWDKEESNLTFPLDGAKLEKSQSLVLQLAIDSSHPLNPTERNQSFSVVLRDKTSKEVVLVLDSSTPALQYVPGKMEITPLTDMTIRTWSAYTPTFTINLPSSSWSSLDKSQLQSLELRFDQTPKGAIVLEEIYFTE